MRTAGMGFPFLQRQQSTQAAHIRSDQAVAFFSQIFRQNVQGEIMRTGDEKGIFQLFL